MSLTAANADEALAVIERELPDFVMMDVNLGSSRDGIDIANEIYRRFGIRSLFTTAYSESALRNRTAGCNPLGWVNKPFSSDTLKSAIRKAAGRLEEDNG